MRDKKGRFTSEGVLENNIKFIEDARSCSEIWNLDNGVTLCKDCHNLTKYGRPKNENK